MKANFEVDLEDYSDIAKLAITLIGTTPNQKIDHKLRIQKLAFLVDKVIRNSDLDDELDFVPLHMGPYSENLESSIHLLKDEGLITLGTGDSLKSELTDKGRLVSNKIKEELPEMYNASLKINEDMKDLTSKELTGLVYELYPSMTENSMIKDNIPATDKFDSFHINVEKMKPGSTSTNKTRLGHELKVSLDSDGNISITWGD